MATTRKNDEQRSVTRTYRAAIRIGEDFITLEETITLPIDASDDDVTRAVDLGWRIYQAQRGAVDAQVGGIRETMGTATAITVRDPDAPASEKQRNYISALQEDLSWTSDQLGGYAHEQQIDLVTMTKGQASAFIDGLKKLAEERVAYGDGGRVRSAARGENSQPAAVGEDQPIHEKQLHALERLAQQQGIDLEVIATQRYQVGAERLSYRQAAALLQEWGRPTRK
ncbi:MAG TPA: hypothetical protein PKA05_10515 [Roseiflexaceae bacterium]|nr:hypothetical protein [Roseiflexaceae bacterium]HMP40802.1 hypothetical protein [Roseiflexaceae bacterium]